VPSITRSGASIAYSRIGSGTAVLMIQGAGLVGNGWRPQVDALARRHTVITVDNRGIGGSSRGDGPLTIEVMADDALAVLQAEGIERFHLAGHSMGGLIAQQIALTVAERVISLSLLCTFLRGAQGARLTPSMLLTAVRMRVGPRQLRRNAFLELVMPAHYLRSADHAQLAETLRPLFGHDLADQPSIVMHQVRAMSRFDVSESLHTLGTIPTLVLSAVHDRIARPVFGRALSAAIPGSRYVEWPDAGHGVTIQCAGPINDLLAEHLNRADARHRAASPAS
jgi:3-oxoadipate enol-lactonase